MGDDQDGEGVVNDGSGTDADLGGKGRKGALFAGLGIASLLLCGSGIVWAGPDEDLMRASENGDLPAIRSALQAGAEVNERSKGGGTPLLEAIVNGHPDAATFLVDHGADVNREDALGHGPLYWAALYGRLDLVRFLVSHGAEVSKPDASGHQITDSVCVRGGKSCPRKEILAVLDSKSSGISGDDIQRIVRIAIRSAIESAQPTGKKGRGTPKQAELAVAAVRFPPQTGSPADRPSYHRPPDSRRYAVVIGIGGYRSFPKAGFAGRDARSVVRRLALLGTPPDQILLLSGSRATGSNITAVMERWLPRHVGASSRVVVFFAGNGVTDRHGEHLLLPWDGRANALGQTGIPLVHLIRDLGRLKARHIVVVLDSGFSGRGARSVRGSPPKPFREHLPKNVTLLTAAGGTEEATMDRNSRHGTFTDSLLKELDRTKGNATTMDLFRSAKTKVVQTSRKGYRRQGPELIGSGRDKF